MRPGAFPICMRQCVSSSDLERSSLDYSLADGFNSDGEASLRSSKIRRTSGNFPAVNLANRLGYRLPSLSRAMRDKTPATSPGRQQNARSAPASRVPSRTPSYRISSMPKPFVNQMDGRETTASDAVAAIEPQRHERRLSANVPVQTPLFEEPIDRKALASTPLLPAHLDERRGSEHGTIQSPLQSPTIADSPVFPCTVLPISTPALSTVASPSLSPKGSSASFSRPTSSQFLSQEQPQSETARIEDKWASTLGHANFVVYPAPYFPEKCDAASCKRLVEDWEEARKQFINQAARTSEHYGPTSQIYKLTEQKWAEIDGLWRKTHETAVEQAKKAVKPLTDSAHDLGLPARDYQPLAEPAPITKLPSLNDPNSTGKFPKLDGGPVGPMVQYAQLTTQASKRTAFLKFFRDLRSPGNTLGH